jgi:hypothetical protein
MARADLDLEFAARNGSHTPSPPRAHERAGRAAAGLAMAAGWLWLIGAAAGLYAALGLERILDLGVFEAVALGCGAALPAVLIWLAGAAAQEAARARAEARRLAEAADMLFNPAPSAEAGARRLAVAVRGEITALDRAMEQALAKVAALDQVISGHARTVGDTTRAAEDGALRLTSTLENEHHVMARIANELNAQIGAIGDAMARHAERVGQASASARSEVQSAEEALEARLSSFAAAAALIGERTRGLSGAAADSADSAQRLEKALEGALEMLARATSLTDAARQSAEQASLAANATAGAVRETTARAVEDARRAAEHIRAQAQRTNPLAGSHSAAREAPPLAEPRGAARRDSAPQQPRRSLSSLFGPRPARAASPPPPPPPEPRQAALEDEGARRLVRDKTPPGTFREGASSDEPVDAARSPTPNAARREGTLFNERSRSPAWNDLDVPGPWAGEEGSGAEWTWKDVLARAEAGEAAVEAEDPAAPRPRPDADEPSARSLWSATALEEDAVARLSRLLGPARQEQTLPAAALVERAGLRLEEIFSDAALDRIAHRARSGSQARRRAVRDAAGDAVERLSALISHDPQARKEAAGFLSREGARIAELLGRGRASMGAAATRAFLLLDAAVG